MTPAVTIRTLREPDIPVLAGVLGRAYGGKRDFEPRLRAYLATDRVATFVAECDGVPAGMVVGNDYGNVAYVSQMAVDPPLQRRGIATRLMDDLTAWIDARGFPAAELDATPMGAPLYVRYGFVDAERTDVYENTAATRPRADPGDAVAIREYVAADRAALLAIDRVVFGADRSEPLGALLDAAPEAVSVAGPPGGALSGYAVAQSRAQMLGPVVAADAVLAGRLIDAARRRMTGPYLVCAASASPALADVLAARSFRLVRSLRHMVRGPAPRADRVRLFVRMNLGQG